MLRGVEGIGVQRFSDKDVVRHPLVQKIVDAYASYSEPAKGNDAEHDAG